MKQVPDDIRFAIESVIEDLRDAAALKQLGLANWDDQMHAAARRLEAALDESGRYRMSIDALFWWTGAIVWGCAATALCLVGLARFFMYLLEVIGSLR